MFKSIYNSVSKLLAKRHIHVIRGLMYLGRPTLIPTSKLDYVRVATLELIAAEILSKEVPGAVAELGVYKGGFAKYINAAFKDRTFYLFDTFSGFGASDVQAEQLKGLSRPTQDFSNTSVEAVLRSLPHLGKCIVRQGLFPGTFSGLEEERFCFVSIDADLYEPIRQGLEVFYPRLSAGGYLMIHDYNNKEYGGCRKAVREFCSRHAIAYAPLPDICGSVVIQKP